MEGQTFEEPLAELSEEEKSFLVCAAAVVLLALGACLRATSHHWSHVSTFCKKNFLNLINRPQNEESRWERRSLYMQVCLQKVILAEIYWRYSACWLIFLTLTRASRILTKDPVWISSFAAWGWVLLAFLIIVWTQVPCATQTWSLDFVCILWYLATGFYLSSWVIPVEQLLLMEFVLFVLVALPLCTFAKHYSVVFLCQGGLMAFVVARAVLEDLPRKRISSQHSVVVLNIVFLGVTLLVHFLSNSFLEQTVELRVREADSQTQRNATSSLLELTCDAVVHLDSELRVTSDARDALAAMLFRSPETLRGTKFTELIATDCQSRAEEMLKEAQAPAHAFHTQLVDGCSSRFRTEVFQVKYTKMNGQRCHLLGLRDFTDVKPLSRPSPDALAADALSVDPDVHSYEMGSLDLASRSDESSVQMPQQLLRPPPRRLTRVMLETGGG